MHCRCCGARQLQWETSRGARVSRRACVAARSYEVALTESYAWRRQIEGGEATRQAERAILRQVARRRHREP